MPKKSLPQKEHVISVNDLVTKKDLNQSLREFGIVLRADIKKDTTEIVGAAVDELAQITSGAFTRLERQIDRKFDSIRSIEGLRF